ncbi:MAG: energy-coupling factor transporter transmembrane protein EcfT [Ruminococcaceae bacterium]|nr:energy-coupling factor transporter transmembrane protein EcfT [Oscillospiraceae bacterium]
MIKDITLGQFFPGNTVIHRLDPRMKIVLTILYIVAIFLAKNVYSFAAVILSAILLVCLSRISWKTILKSMKPLIFVLAFTTFFNVFWTKGDHLLVQFWVVEIYLEGIYYALMMIIRVTTLLMGTTVLLTYTTSPIMLTDGLERLLAPLRKIRLPVHEFSMMMTIALRFIPTLIEETDKIMSAQKARGADFESGSLAKRAKALVPILIPLFISAFRRADELATAMECRCYRGGDGRTRMTALKWTKIDIFALLIMLAFMGGVIGMNYIPTTIAI